MALGITDWSSASLSRNGTLSRIRCRFLRLDRVLFQNVFRDLVRPASICFPGWQVIDWRHATLMNQTESYQVPGYILARRHELHHLFTPHPAALDLDVLLKRVRHVVTQNVRLKLFGVYRARSARDAVEE